MATKMTKRDYFSVLFTEAQESGSEYKCEKGTISNAEILNFLNHELELLEKKNKTSGGEKKLSARQTENEAFKAEILDYMDLGSRYTPDELLAGVPNQPAEMTKNRLVACVAQLVKDGAVVVVKEKGKTYYTLTD